MPDQTQIAQQYKTRYITALTDSAGGKEKTRKKQDSDYEQLASFVYGLTQAKNLTGLDTCIKQYLAIYLRYSPEDRRAKMAFFHLLSSRIDNSRPEDPYLKKVSNEIDEKQGPFTTWRVRFDSLEEDQKNQIRKLLKRQEALRNQHASIFDELNEAYASTHAGRKASTEQLYGFNPVADSSLETSFRNLTARCLEDWNKCQQELSDANWSQLKASLKNFVDFLRTHEQEKLTLFQILKWCRDVYAGKTITSLDRGRQVVGTAKTPTDAMTDEFYFQSVYAVFLRAHRVVNPVLYRDGFPPGEQTFFMGPLKGLYRANYKNRLTFGVSRASGFLDSSSSFLWLLLFARTKRVSLVEDDKLKQIAELYKAVVDVANAGPAKPEPKKPERTISTRGLATWDYAKGYFKIGDKLGAGPSETEIVYFEGENTKNPRIYLEYTHMRGPLFEVDLYTFLSRVEATPRLMVWEANKGLLRLIAEYFGFLFTMFFPGVGYFGLFLEKGFIGVLRQVLEQEAIEVLIDKLSERKASGLGGDFGGFEWLSILASGKNVGSKLAKKAEREAMLQAKADMRALEGKSVPLLEQGEEQASRLNRRELGNLGLDAGGASEGEAKALERQRMMELERERSLNKIERQKEAKLERDERALEREKHPNQRSTRSKSTSERAVPPHLSDVAKINPVTESEREARAQFARDLEENHMPPGTRVRVPRTPQTSAGLQQNLAMTPSGSPAIFDVDIEIDFSNEVRSQLDRSLRKSGRAWKKGSFGVDGIKFFPAAKPAYMLMDHKEVFVPWGKSFYATEKAAEKFRTLLEEHLAVGRVLREYGYVGTEFTTNDPNLRKFLEEMIADLRKSVPSGEWTGLYVSGPR